MQLYYLIVFTSRKEDPFWNESIVREHTSLVEGRDVAQTYVTSSRLEDCEMCHYVHYSLFSYIWIVRFIFFSINKHRLATTGRSYGDSFGPQPICYICSVKL